MEVPILYTFRRCPYAMRARLAILASGVQVELREVLLRDKPTELIEAAQKAGKNKATTPTLVLPDGTVIAESLDIMHWALQQHDPQNLLKYPHTLDVLISTNDGDFKHALDRYKYITRYPEDADKDWRVQGEKFLTTLEQKLAKTPYLAGATPTLPDIAIFPFIRQFRMPDKTWFDEQAPYPNVQQWLQKCIGTPEFKTVMTKFQVWQLGEKPLLWPVS